jgi:hypothetical protein
MKHSQRPWKRIGVGSCIAASLATIVYAADARFDMAIDAVDKARALVIAAEGDALNPANQALLDLLRRQAKGKLDEAEALIVQARTLADQP